jgi:hypothetical protein
MGDEPDVGKQLHGTQAKKLIKEILKNGIVGFVKHAKDEMANDNLCQTDVINVLERGRIYEPADLSTRGDWRYRVHTDQICVVVSFRSCTDLTVVTVWRKGGGK